MASTTVSDVITWANSESALKSFLGISGAAEDVNLELWLTAAAEMADRYLERLFEYEAPVTPAEAVPVNVELGCYVYVQYARGAASRDPNVTSVKTAQLQENYVNPAGAASQASVFAGALLAARVWWDPWKKNAQNASGL